MCNLTVLAHVVLGFLAHAAKCVCDLQQTWTSFPPTSDAESCISSFCFFVHWLFLFFNCWTTTIYFTHTLTCVVLQLCAPAVKKKRQIKKLSTLQYTSIKNPFRRLYNQNTFWKMFCWGILWLLWVMNLMHFSFKIEFSQRYAPTETQKSLIILIKNVCSDGQF